MGSWVLFEFAFQCFSFVAWPCLALGYPLFASIRAIETKSDYHCKKLVTYWILFSLISLFEHAFFNQLQRIPVWYFTKLAIVCWLVIPSFNGAVSVYKLFVQPCIYVDLHDAINWFMRQNNYLRRKHNFLDELDKFINDNGTEALEKMLANKLTNKILKPCFVAEETKLAACEDEELKTTKSCLVPEQSNAAAENSDVVIKYQQSDINILKVTEKIEATQANQIKYQQHGILPPPPDIKILKVTEKIEATEAKQVSMEVNTYTRRKMFKLKEIMETSTAAATKACRADPPIIPALKTVQRELTCATTAKMGACKSIPLITPAFKTVQKEWTCAICQVTTSSERTLNSHLKGKRHVAACEKLKSMTRASKDKLSCPSASKEKQKPNVDTPRLVGECKWWSCTICDVKCNSENDLRRHLVKHLSNVSSLTA